MEILTEEVRKFLSTIEGQNITLRDLRSEFNILPGTKSFDTIRRIAHRLVDQKILRLVGKRGEYKVVKRVEPVRVFIPGRERRPIFNLRFPEDKQKGMEIDFAQYIVLREGDLITIGGVKSKGKTTLCLNLAGANIDKNPVLMGNEYTIFTEGKFEPSPRFLNRLDTMSSWINWVDSEGNDKFTLLPVREDYAEHIIKDRINIIDWINLDAGQLYEISKVLEDIKSALGKGIGIVALQKGEGTFNPRGGQFVRDFSDVELLLDGYGNSDDDVLLTIKGVKEKTASIIGKTYVFSIVEGGTQIWNFHEVKKCPKCWGRGHYSSGGECAECNGSGYLDRQDF